MRLVSVNVNGIRAALRRGGLSWLHAQQPDVIALQEVRASPEDLRTALAAGQFADWHLAHAAAADAGRAGVAILSRQAIADMRIGLPGFPDAGRWIEAQIGAVTVISAYVHTGEAGTARQGEKYGFLDAAGTRMAALVDGQAVLTGDLNVCHTARDLRNTRGNVGKAGYLPQEQAYLSRWADAGWVDVVRARAGDVDGPYTWWSWRGKAFDNDTGWRIDYQWASPALASTLSDTSVGRAASYAERWSDHAPVVVDYDLP
ncbi:MAG: exodeoxyribonuclease III [Actinomycetota bacterium]|nr:exodeoxyribonuclease III [Actinomycetota bacterium]